MATLLSVAWMMPSANAQTESRVIASDGKSAMDCVRLELVSEASERSPKTQWVLVNGCSDDVEVAWCSDDECAREAGNMWTVKPGRSWPVSAERQILWGACHGKNSIHGEKGTRGARHYCSAPDESTRNVDSEDPESMADSVGEPPAGTILRRDAGASNALLEGFAQAEQWQAEAPAREAAARANAARLAEEERKLKEQHAQQPSGGNGWATFLGALGAAAGAAVQIQGQQQSSAPRTPTTDCNCMGTAAECMRTCEGNTPGQCAWIRPCSN